MYAIESWPADERALFARLAEDLGKRALVFIGEVGAMSMLAAQTFYHAATPPYNLTIPA